MELSWHHQEINGKPYLELRGDNGFPELIVRPLGSRFTDNMGGNIGDTKEDVALAVSAELIRFYRTETPWARCFIRREIGIIRAIRSGSVEAVR